MKRPPANPGAGRAPQPHGGDPAPHLSAEERALWSHVAASIAPIRTKSRVTHHAASGGHDASPRPRHAHHHEPAPSRPVAGTTTHAGSSAAPAAGLAQFDARKARRIAKGRTGIEARLDLHGLRQDEAHLRLRRFLHDCHRRGLKHVLVITGKGRLDDDGGIAFPDALHRPARGVLRRNVPRWLAEPDLRHLVVGFTSASIRHGGDGALYIELRRRR